MEAAKCIQTFDIHNLTVQSSRGSSFHARRHGLETLGADAEMEELIKTSGVSLLTFIFAWNAKGLRSHVEKVQTWLLNRYWKLILEGLDESLAN